MSVATENRCTVTDSLRSIANTIVYEVAQEHGVRIIELVTTPYHKSKPVAAARHEVIRRLRAEVVWRYPPGYCDPSRREYRLRSEIPNGEADLWRTVSTTDIARLLAANHSTVVLALQSKTKRTLTPSCPCGDDECAKVEVAG